MNEVVNARCCRWKWRFLVVQYLSRYAQDSLRVKYCISCSIFLPHYSPSSFLSAWCLRSGICKPFSDVETDGVTSTNNISVVPFFFIDLSTILDSDYDARSLDRYFCAPLLSPSDPGSYQYSSSRRTWAKKRGEIHQIMDGVLVLIFIGYSNIGGLSNPAPYTTEWTNSRAGCRCRTKTSPWCCEARLHNRHQCKSYVLYFE